MPEFFQGFLFNLIQSRVGMFSARELRGWCSRERKLRGLAFLLVDSWSRWLRKLQVTSYKLAGFHRNLMRRTILPLGIRVAVPPAAVLSSLREQGDKP